MYYSVIHMLDGVTMDGITYIKSIKSPHVSHMQFTIISFTYIFVTNSKIWYTNTQKYR